MKASFRDYVNTLRRNDELLEISKPVDLRDIAALVAQSEKALLFKNLIWLFHAGRVRPITVAQSYRPRHGCRV